MKILFIAGLAVSILNFCRPLIAALQTKEIEMHLIAPDLELVEKQWSFRTFVIANIGICNWFDRILIPVTIVQDGNADFARNLAPSFFPPRHQGI